MSLRFLKLTGLCRLARLERKTADVDTILKLFLEIPSELEQRRMIDARAIQKNERGEEATT